MVEDMVPGEAAMDSLIVWNLLLYAKEGYC